MAEEVLAIADRIDELGSAPEVRAECGRLRELARSATGLEATNAFREASDRESLHEPR